MADAFFDKFITDLIKGAETNSSGMNVNVQVSKAHDGREEKLANLAGLGAGNGHKDTFLERASVKGAADAAATLGVKEAFLGALAGSVLGPALGRGAAGMLGKTVGKGIGGALFDQAAGMAGGALGSKLERPLR